MAVPQLCASKSNRLTMVFVRFHLEKFSSPVGVSLSFPNSILQIVGVIKRRIEVRSSARSMQLTGFI